MISVLLLTRLGINLLGSSILFIINVLIYKRTPGASKTYYFWAFATTFLFLGALYSLVASFFFDVDNIEHEGASGLLAVVYLSLYLVGYYHLALGALVLPADLKITNYNIEKIIHTRKYVFIGILIWSSFVSLLLALIDSKIPIRIFYQPFIVICWLCTFYAVIPLYNTLKNYAPYWKFLLLGTLCGFVGSTLKILGYLFFEPLFYIEAILYVGLAMFVILGFYKLGKDLEAL